MTATARRGPRGVTARTRVVIGPGRRDGVALTSVQAQPPLGVRLAGGEVHLMGTAGGPHGGDQLHLQVLVLEGVQATVRSVAATVALPGDGGHSIISTDVQVQAGASLRWLVEPLVVAAGADHRTRTSVEVDPSARLLWREEVVLGRSNEQPGRLACDLRLTRRGRALLHQGMAIGVPGWDGPAVTGGMGALGLVAVVGSTASSEILTAPADKGHPIAHGLAWNRLSDDLTLLTGVAPDFATWRSRLSQVDPGWAV